MAKKKNLSVAKTPAEASAKAAAISKMEQGLPLTPEERNLVEGKSKVQIAVDPKKLDKVGAKKYIREQMSESEARLAAIEEDTASLTQSIDQQLADLEAVDKEIKSDITIAEKDIETADLTTKLAKKEEDIAKILEGEDVIIDDGEDDTPLTSADINKMLADLYASIQDDAIAEKRKASESAYTILFNEFSTYGLGSLVQDIRKYVEDGVSGDELTLRLRESKAYQDRFAANPKRISKGLRALSEADYLDLEDRYQNIMQRYGLPPEYYKRGDLGRQLGFEELIANDVRDDELADRLDTAYNRVINANPEVTQSLRQFYPDISNGDILAYTLDPKNALLNIKRKVSAAEIGGAAMGQGLGTSVARAEELLKYGVTKETAQQGYQTIAGGIERGRQLAALQQAPEYTQTTAEAEVFGLSDAAKARQQRQKIIETETATFGGRTGAQGGALARERAGAF